MGQIRLPGNPGIDVLVKRSAKARRLSLRMSQLDGRVTLTLPKGVPDSEGLAFLRSKEAWLRGHLDQRTPDVRIAAGAVLPIEGRDHTVTSGAGRGVALHPGQVVIGGNPDTLPARLKGWLKARARDRLAEASDRYALRLGRPYSAITLRDTRSRWGSCTAQGRLMYSWRLILAPSEVLDYVAAHEVAHLAEMNHSRAFWDTVGRLHGDWQDQRRWLRDEGSALHRYRFD